MARKRKGNFTMFAFDGLHGTPNDVGVLAAGSLVQVLPGVGIAGAQFVDAGLTSITSHTYVNESRVLVMTSTPVSVFLTADGTYRTAMPVVVTLQEPTRMTEKHHETFTTLLEAGTELGLSANAVVEIVRVADGSSVGEGSGSSGKPFPWLPVLIGVGSVGLTLWFLRSGKPRGGKRGGR